MEIGEWAERTDMSGEQGSSWESVIMAGKGEMLSHSIGVVVPPRDALHKGNVTLLLPSTSH